MSVIKTFGVFKLSLFNLIFYCSGSCQSLDPLGGLGAYMEILLIWASCDFAGVHVAAHLVNALNFSVNFSEDFAELNAARYRDEVGGLLSLVVSPLIKVCDFHGKFVPCCSFWVLLKCSCQVEFCSFSIENTGNYYFTVSPAENGSSRVSTFYILQRSDGGPWGLPPASQQHCLVSIQWRLSTVSSRAQVCFCVLFFFLFYFFNVIYLFCFLFF